MTDGLNGRQVRFLTYLIYVLISVVAAATSYNFWKIAEFPEKYLLLERYSCDQQRIESSLHKIDTKLDRMIERAIPVK
jgi:hypothetical protein